VENALVDDPELLGTPSQADDMPPRDQFLRALGVADSKAAGLLRVLLAKCSATAPLADQVLVLEQLGRFIVAGPGVPGSAQPQLARLRLLVDALELVPAAQVRFQALVQSVLSQLRAVKLFGEIGMPNDRGLLAETTDRLARALLPEPPALHELWRVCSHIIRKVHDLDWLGVEADPLLYRLAKAGGGCFEPLRASILDSIGMITTRIAALGMSEAFRTRAVVGGGVRESPLYHLTRVQPSEMPALIEASRHHLENVRAALEDRGVSIEVVYQLDAIEKGLARLQLLLPLASDEEPSEPTPHARKLIESVGRGLVGGRSFVQLMSDNLRLLARKVIERAGRTGEHYVTSSRREYWKMLASAAGGGVLTCGTAAAKFVVKWGHWPLFVDGALSSADYAASFVLMQLLGFTLATKQPSMTAASLAGTIRDKAGPGRLDELVRLIARIARSQFAAAVGNVSAVIVTAMLFDQVWIAMRGAPFLDAETAKGVVGSFNPIATGTVFFAALTGVILWISSLFAGWFENWVVYRRIPEAIEHHRYIRRFGKQRLAKLARFLEHEAAGFGGSVSLGVMLGMTPVLAKFFGLPLDVRHITLSTGGLTLAMDSVGIAGVGVNALIWACVGIAIIGLLNFGVSFALALVVALRARDVPRGERRTLPLAVLRKFVRQPLLFFYPPRDEVPSAHAEPPTH